MTKSYSNLHSLFFLCAVFFIFMLSSLYSTNIFGQNDKQVYPEGICNEKFVQRSNLPLTYTIRFQNKTSNTVRNVTVIDSLSTRLRRNSYSLVSSSHTVVVDSLANSNALRFRFNNINLVDSASNPELSKGFLIFKINEVASTALDTSRINNKSHIFFDTNTPIITNTVSNTVVFALSTCTPTTATPPICVLPTDLKAEALSSTVSKLSWKTPANTTAINYEILRNGQRINTVTSSQLSYTDSSLVANTQYIYSIKTICGNSDTTSRVVIVRTIPATPTLLSVVSPCKGERGTINVQSSGVTYRVYDSLNATTPLLETNNSSIQTPNLNDTTTFYVSVVISGRESQRLRVVVPIKEVIEATIEQGSLLESCATNFVLSAKEVAGATYTWFRENVQVGVERTLTTAFEARYRVRVIKDGCFSNSEFITTRFVNAPTARITQGDSVTFCQNGILNAQDASVNVVYTWTLNGTNVGNGSQVSVSEAGIYTLKAGQPSCGDSTTIVVSISTPPTITLSSNKVSICPTEEALLSATEGTGFVYKWFRDGTAIANTSSTLSTSQIGTYRVEVTTPEGCQSTTSDLPLPRSQAETARVTVNKEDAVDKTITVSSSDSIVSVAWFKDGSEIPSFANQITITPTESGDYKARVTYALGCQFETPERPFVFTVVQGIEEESAKIFTVYPNPNNGSFKVEFVQTTNQKTNLVLVDALGRTVHSQEISMNEKSVSVTLPRVKAGVYVVQIVSEGKVYTKQLIIQ